MFWLPSCTHLSDISTKLRLYSKMRGDILFIDEGRGLLMPNTILTASKNSWMSGRTVFQHGGRALKYSFPQPSRSKSLER